MSAPPPASTVPGRDEAGSDAPAARRRAAIVLLAALATVTVLAWWVTLGAGMNAAAMVMMATDGQPGDLLLFLGIWGTMMVAMMFPASAPMAEAFVHLSAREEDRRPWLTGRAVAFLGTYAAVWTAVGLAFASGYWLLGPRLPDLARVGTVGPWVAGTILLAAGAYQVTPLKDACLSGCRSPFSFLSTGWRSGLRGAVRLGARHAAYCVGCCAMLFAVLFAVGIMAIGWMALVALVIFTEKLLIGVPARVVSWAIGGALGGLGVAILAVPTFASWGLGLS